jgi:hypothetical protein
MQSNRKWVAVFLVTLFPVVHFDYLVLEKGIKK